ncbi:MAG TPA: Spy/CpxP family protein refolding chaperone [Ignavibacteriales bacterium]|nr:Spy/CpxP family protein refolding chaperone [Ignavibacteriales bacterium]
MKQLTFLLAAFLLSLFVSPSWAQEAPAPPSKAGHLRHLKKELQLNESQTAKVKEILKSSRGKLDSLRSKMEDAREKDMEEMDKIMEEQDNQISNVLNADQKKKFEDLKNRGPEMDDRSFAPGRGMHKGPGLYENPGAPDDMLAPEMPGDDL